ncbi:MAG: metallophosphoesterase [Alphaproteobacteria bacterium]|nr:metallophosphoesterase [Alphaproteobacteria bacterium]
MFLIYLTALMLLLYGYVEHRLVLVSGMPKWLVVGVSGFLLLGVVNIAVVIMWGKELPVWIVRGCSLAHIFLIWLVLGAALFDVLKLCHVLRENKGWIIVLSCFLLSCYGLFNASRIPSVKQVQVSFPHLPQNWKPLKVVQLTDLHIGGGFDGRWLQEVVDKTMEQKPDLIVITGDTTDEPVHRLAKEVEPLKRLKAPLGVYMIFGNHEYYSGYRAWQEYFSKTEIELLTNTRKKIEHDGNVFVIAGYDNGPRYSHENADKKLSEIMESTKENELKILLSHHPALFQKSQKIKNVLQLSGHTHGGMFFPVSLLTKVFNGGYVKGLYETENSKLYVSDGTGLWGGFPARIGTENEITVLTIKR